MKQIKHNKNWFYNRIGIKVYCSDHMNPKECEGILLDSVIVCKNVMENQKRGIEFYDNPPT